MNKLFEIYDDGISTDKQNQRVYLYSEGTLQSLEFITADEVGQLMLGN
jgi:hypothetical protein